MDYFPVSLAERCERLHAERRADETRAMLATAGGIKGGCEQVSMDGKCTHCSEPLMLGERQPHLSRDWAWCSRCDWWQGTREGVL